MIVRSPASSQVRAAGVVVLALGLWGALIPFVGPTFGYGMGGAQAGTGPRAVRPCTLPPASPQLWAAGCC